MRTVALENPLIWLVKARASGLQSEVEETWAAWNLYFNFGVPPPPYFNLLKFCFQWVVLKPATVKNKKN